MRIFLDSFYLLPVILGWLTVGICAAAYMSYIRKGAATTYIVRLIPIFVCVCALLFIAWGVIRNL